MISPLREDDQRFKKGKKKKLTPSPQFHPPPKKNPSVPYDNPTVRRRTQKCRLNSHFNLQRREMEVRENMKIGWTPKPPLPPPIHSTSFISPFSNKSSSAICLCANLGSPVQKLHLTVNTELVQTRSHGSNAFSTEKVLLQALYSLFVAEEKKAKVTQRNFKVYRVCASNFGPVSLLLILLGVGFQNKPGLWL